MTSTEIVTKVAWNMDLITAAEFAWMFCQPVIKIGDNWIVLWNTDRPTVH